MESWIREYEEFYRKTADKILFDISYSRWNPSQKFLDGFCRILFSRLYRKYKELEMTQEYEFTGEILLAEIEDRVLAFTVGGGATTSESSCTHAIGWELGRLLDAHKLSQEPFNFRLLVVGYKNDGKQPSPEKTIDSRLILK
ncbi:MAG: hypothetical protein UT08_C0022G0001 [Candidatus Woesebacteria bacterium GW2011_GWB1_38_8]|uniref:Uncharacterized protein n=1 Tax=Candidatus Woesebacteria bacterium GW2011_GWB1_38_8 TaxID=1618570 RepID=A0A0G0NE59_9BACT|nr:MAG: hypothetical protein UT08_C0022G0001 [Candidatus Woesebacteria bacterium GW2011_GWB1_38_8]